jgi:predicted ester cyclase
MTAPTGIAASNGVDLEANRALVLRALELLTGSAPLDEVHSIFTADYVDHNAPGSSDPAWVAKIAGRLRTAFPDFSHAVEACIAEGDQVCLRSVMTGTQDGEFAGPDFVLPPTGRRVSVRNFHMFRVRDGRIAEHWALRDDLSFFRQLGLIPAPGGPPAGAPGGPAAVPAGG